MAVRGLMRGALMLAVGALITWALAGALEQHAVAHNNAAAQEFAPAIAASKAPASRWRF